MENVKYNLRLSIQFGEVGGKGVAKGLESPLAARLSLYLWIDNHDRSLLPSFGRIWVFGPSVIVEQVDSLPSESLEIDMAVSGESKAGTAGRTPSVGVGIHRPIIACLMSIMRGISGGPTGAGAHLSIGVLGVNPFSMALISLNGWKEAVRGVFPDGGISEMAEEMPAVGICTCNLRVGLLQAWRRLDIDGGVSP